MLTKRRYSAQLRDPTVRRRRRDNANLASRRVDVDKAQMRVRGRGLNGVEPPVSNAGVFQDSRRVRFGHVVEGRLDHAVELNPVGDTCAAIPEAYIVGQVRPPQDLFAE